MGDPLWLQVGSIGAGGILVVMVLDRVVRCIALVKNGRARANGTGAPAWRVAELLAQILGTMKEMRHDLARLSEQVGSLDDSMRKADE